MKESPIKFLIAPFTRGVWICIAASSICVFFVAPFVMRHRQIFLFSRNVFLIIAFCYAFLAAVYSSHLKALLTQQSTSLPFQNLFDLAKRIDEGSKRLIVEDKQSMRWRLLTISDRWRPPALQAVYDALQNRGIEETLIFEPNMTKICHLLASSTEFVYFGYDEIVYAACGRMCLWKYAVVEYPETPVTLPVSKLSPAVKNADVVVHALENFRQTLIRRKYGGPCVPEKSEKELIGMRSLIGAIMLLSGGLSASLVTLAVERLVNNRHWRIHNV